MIGRWRRWGGRLDSWFARATLQPRQFVPQLLVFGAQCLILSHQCLNQVEQLRDHLPSGRVGDGIKVDIGNLHTDDTLSARQWM
jgi:hypothetical protein